MLVNFFPSVPARGELFTVIVIAIVGGSIGVAGIGSFNSGSHIVSATFAFSNPAITTMSPAGDIVVIAGLEKANVADTICDPELNEPIPATPIDPPTMAITITVNSSPLAGTEGKKLTSTQIRDRLVSEAQNNVGITFSQNTNVDSFVISGRGELMLEILLTQMRREGFEMTVSPPKVLFQKDEASSF